MPDSTAPDTIVLIHGFWVTPRSWETGSPTTRPRVTPSSPRPTPASRSRSRRCNADHADRGAHRRRRSSTTSRRSSARSTRHRSSWATRRVACSRRSCSTAATARSASPSTRPRPRASKIVPLSQVRSVFPVLKNPANRHKAVGSPRAVAVRLHQHLLRGRVAASSTSATTIPASGRIFWESVLANIQPGHRTTTGSTTTTPPGARCCSSPGSEDHLMPPSIQQSNAKHYKAEGTVTEVDRVRGPAPVDGPGGLGGGRRPRAHLGGRARRRVRLIGGHPIDRRRRLTGEWRG